MVRMRSSREDCGRRSNEKMAQETQDRPKSGNAALPEFDSPPLAETVFGVRFPRLKGWDVRHFRLFWDYVRADFPEFEVNPALAGPSAAERLAGKGFAIKVMDEPELRCWYLTSDTTRLLQIQADGFFHNWRKVTLEEEYPRYRTPRPSFEREWDRFRTFLDERAIGSSEVVQCEAHLCESLGDSQLSFQQRDRRGLEAMARRHGHGFIPDEVGVVDGEELWEQIMANLRFSCEDDAGEPREPSVELAAAEEAAARVDFLGFGMVMWDHVLCGTHAMHEGTDTRTTGVRALRLDRQPITWWHAFERAGGYAAGPATAPWVSQRSTGIPTDRRSMATSRAPS